MKTDSLRALLIDQQLGELPPEASELLDAFLARSPEAEAEATKMQAALGLTERTVNERADLFRVEEESKRTLSYPIALGLFRAAAFAIVFLFVGLFGFYLGNQKSPQTRNSQSLLASTEKSPWAQYRLSEDSGFALISNSSGRKNTEKE